MVGLVIIIIAAGLSFFAYPSLPDEVVSHWNAQGQPDDTMAKFWGAALMPLVGLILWIILLVVPRIDPKRENIEKFRASFDHFIISLFAFFLYIHVLMLAWNLGYTFSIIRFLVPAFAILFYDIGILLSHAQRNWTIGIRTPWTMSSEAVWQKTHKAGSYVFKAVGVVTLVGLLYPDQAIWIFFVPLIASVVFLVVYSYVLYSKEHKK